MSLNPSPPSALGEHITSHETQCVCLFPFLLPHQKLRINELMWRHKPLGSLKSDTENVGIACTTELINTSFPPSDKIISIHPCTCFQTLSLKNLKAPFRDRPTSKGMPRYFSLSDSFGTCIIFLTDCLTVSGHPLLKKDRGFVQI
jgi:hypothetical protein